MTTASNKGRNWKYLIGSLVMVAATIGLAVLVYQNATKEGSAHPFKLGLDLAGGSHLVYRADVSGVDPSEVDDAMSVLREVIERRVNIFGVSEPLIQVEAGSVVTGDQEHRLVVELLG